MITYEIETNQATLAVSFLDYHTEPKDLSRYIMPLYFTAIFVDNSNFMGNISFYEAVPCEETFASVESKSAMQEIDFYGPWFYPKLDTYRLEGGKGLNLFMSAMKCNDSLRLLGYPKDKIETECEDDKDIEAFYRTL